MGNLETSLKILYTILGVTDPSTLIHIPTLWSHNTKHCFPNVACLHDLVDDNTLIVNLAKSAMAK